MSGGKSMRQKIITVMLSLALSGYAAPVFAQEDSTYTRNETGRLVITKLFRGLANAATGWMEIPKQIFLTHEEMGGGAAFTWGLVKGVGYAVGRSVVGGFEIATFPIPVPEGYGAIMQPEYVLSDLPAGAPQPSPSRDTTYR
jgi:putative exosortase-associated protein (TIGR04073 family)